MIEIPEIGTCFTEDELQSRFKCQTRRRGIRISDANKVIILVDTHSPDKTGYQNEQKSPKFWTYMGEGQDDQEMVGNNNSIEKAKDDNRRILYFDKGENKKLYFQGVVKYDSHSYKENVKNKDGIPRRVIVFKLKPI